MWMLVDRDKPAFIPETGSVAELKLVVLMEFRGLVSKTVRALSNSLFWGAMLSYFGTQDANDDAAEHVMGTVETHRF
jgi:hypothetical protein